MGPVDLTMTVSDGMPAFPGSPEPRFIPWNAIGADGFAMELLFMSSHTGTHMDAPSHFAKGGRSMEKIPPGRLVSKGVLVDACGPRVITRGRILEHEKRAGRIPRGSAVVLKTGWSDDPGRKSYFGSCPGLAADAARHIASRGVNIVGIDSPSIDAGGRGYPAHHILARADIPIVENLANLGKIRGEFTLAVLPLKLRGATGAPARALAL
ncbi:metal-dependent hydrolase [Cenarchaeum symbiosum A]|uniref:Metal-dependent hydrolase n=1 Tax=Cenarchaeum symbiosum (strain A) TaxID=414004 RepID=A0RUA7_CENSY|nr:metal-dependent hydrolase [Cenarchaeum symbiosum A]